MIDVEWYNLWRTNSPHDIFTRFDHYFQFNFYETPYIFNEYEINIIGVKEKSHHENIIVTQVFQ